jgi:hypothetical protein
MAMYLKLHDVDSLKHKLDGKASDLFKARAGVAQLQVSRYKTSRSEDTKESFSFLRNRDLKDASEIKKLREEPNSNSEVFFVRQDRSWTTLNISRNLLEAFMSQYEVFPQFWKCVFTFGRKDHENEFEFPEFRARRTFSEMESETNGGLNSWI